MKKGPIELSVILTIILIICLIFLNKFINIANGLSVSISLIIYPLTFVIPVLIYRKHKSTITKKAILSSGLYVVIFYAIILMLVNVTSNIESSLFDEQLIAVFAPNNLAIGNTLLYYPQLFIIGFLIIYILTRFVLIAVYDAVTTYTNTYLGFSLALFITFIIDIILLVPLYNFTDIFNGNLSTIGFIQHLTANFIVMIFISTLLSLFYPLIIKYYK